ncbi:MAG: hypothetical protein P9M08_02715 [Candidatus Erginobacter occultus]|nr:hypothetical protein [Candidatus Erginobacter occultus]
MSEKFNRWFSVIFLLITWYIPRQTAPGGYLADYIGLRWITYILIPAIIVIFCLYRLRVKPRIYVGYIIWPILALFSVILISAVVNYSSVIETGFTLLIYLRYPLLFIVLINLELNERSLLFILKVVLFLVIIQIPETFCRYFIWGIRWDHISWTLGPWGHFDLGVYMIYTSALLVAKSLIERLKASYVILIVCFFLIGLFGEIKAFILFAPVVIGFVIWTCLGIRIPKRRFYAILGICTVSILAFVAVIDQYEKIFPESKDLQRLQTALDPRQEGRYQRISAFTDILGELKKTSSPILFGWGPGSSLAGELGAQKRTKFNITIRHKNQLAETFIDIGSAGLLAYYCLIFCLFIQFRRHYKVEDNPTYKILNRALMGMWLFYAFLGPLYDLVWRHDSSNYLFFFFSAVVFSRYREIRNEGTAGQ